MLGALGCDLSGLARRMAFVWAVLPPLAIGILEKAAFNTSLFGEFVGHRLAGPQVYSFTAPGGTTQVHRFRPSDGSVTLVAQVSETIVGAGVSTCAPQR